MFDWMLMTIALFGDGLGYGPKRSRKADDFTPDRFAKAMPASSFSSNAQFKRAASTVNPGPNAKATHGLGARARRNRSRTKRMVGEDMLPWSAKTW
jgi:hypothetical protein